MLQYTCVLYVVVLYLTQSYFI